MISHEETYFLAIRGIRMINESSQRSSKNRTIKFEMSHTQVSGLLDVLIGKDSQVMNTLGIDR